MSIYCIIVICIDLKRLGAYYNPLQNSTSFTQGKEIKEVDRRRERKEYEEYLYQKELSARTVQIYLIQLDRFWDFLGKRPISKKETVAYKASMREKGWKVTTVNLYTVAINSYLLYSNHTECVLRTERVQRRQCPDNVLSGREYHRLLEYARQIGNEKYYCIMRTLALTGIRISELSGCSVESLKNGKFTISNKRKTREVYLPPKLIKDLEKYCQMSNINSGPIFLGNCGKAINRISVYKMLINMAGEAEIPREKVHPHSFRHLFAITYMKTYSNLFELADILGHSSLETTRIYTASSAEEKRTRINCLEL